MHVKVILIRLEFYMGELCSRGGGGGIWGEGISIAGYRVWYEKKDNIPTTILFYNYLLQNIFEFRPRSLEKRTGKDLVQVVYHFFFASDTKQSSKAECVTGCYYTATRVGIAVVVCHLHFWFVWLFSRSRRTDSRHHMKVLEAHWYTIPMVVITFCYTVA